MLKKFKLLTKAKNSALLKYKDGLCFGLKISFFQIKIEGGLCFIK